MKELLHILTTPDDPVAEAIIAAQRSLPDTKVSVVDWTAGEPDFDRLLNQIFAADSVAIW